MAFVGGMLATSCGDNTDYSSVHVYTDEELAYLEQKRIEDSIKRAQIPADYVLEYTVEDYPTPDGIWTSKVLEIDLEQIGQWFGLSGEEVMAGINQEDGAPVINGYAIANTTHAEYNKRSTSNGLWGHWFDVNGDPGTWGDLTAVGNIGFYVEWQDEYFAVGQFPGKYEAGQSFKAIEALSYQGTSVAIIVNFNLIERGAVTGGVVYEETLYCTQTPRSVFDSDAIEFNVGAVKAALGVSSMEEAEMVAVNPDGSYNQVPTANGGWWYDFDGNPGAYPGAFYIEYYGMYDPEDESYFYLGQMPGELSAGYTASPKIGFMNGDKIAMFTVEFDVEAYQDPETAPAGDPEDITIDITLEKPWTEGFETVGADIRDMVRDAFKMTTYQIYTASLTEDGLTLYNKEIIDEPYSTADGKYENWLDLNGDQTYYMEGSAIFAGISFSETAIEIYIGNFPDTNFCPTDTEIKTSYILTNKNGGSVTINLTAKIGDAAVTE